ncbi:GNAT family N-acetyltransferase [Macrococcus animalis]|uniref:GNAT family N-acetyltransferase n=1 Tax=Macrococcus animalis TaxID=3395467 RepID=UPI0039BE58F2
MIRKFMENDIYAIQQMNQHEGWDNLVVRHEQTLAAWMNSESYVYIENGQVVSAIRAITDGHVSLYVCELITHHESRGNGYAKALMDYVHALYPTTRMELLATSSSKSYYENHFRPFYGFRRTFLE